MLHILATGVGGEFSNALTAFGFVVEKHRATARALDGLFEPTRHESASQSSATCRTGVPCGLILRVRLRHFVVLRVAQTVNGNGEVKGTGS